MGKYRKRFNEKARSGMVAKQLALKKARQKSLRVQDEDESELNPPPTTEFDPNAEVLLPMTSEEKLQKKKELEEILKPPEAKISGAKRKRLDKYIDKQVRKMEKQELLEKMQEHKFDTSLLKSMKTLGSGGDTKRQKIEEALALERSGQGNDDTRELLYEERTVKEWTAGQPEPFPSTGADDDTDEPKTSMFIDHRPQGPQGSMIQGFSNVTKVAKSNKPAYNWRARLEQEKARKRGIDMYNDDDSDSDDSSDGSESEDATDDGSEETSESEEEWSGFVDTNGKTSAPVSNGDVESVNSDAAESSGEESSDEDSEDDNTSEGEESDEEEGDEPSISKGQEFKKWAEKQTISEERLETPIYKGEYTPVERPEDEEAIPAEYNVPQNGDAYRKSFYVTIDRKPEVQSARLELPVVREEQRIMEAIYHNDCIVICGETGSGKTTQVPQFLFEAGYGHPHSETPGLIGITQPRRVAAVSMANRVASELANHGDKVAYQIRFDATVKANTAVKFMTDGVLLRELSSDLTLSKYSCIIIDEAHERNVNTDILIGMLSRVLKMRREMSNEDPSIKPLKIVIMSATLRVSDFTGNTNLFSTPPPVLKVDARQYPVSVHFNRRTVHDYVDEAYRKAVKIHQRLPPGGILIFLTGQNEIRQVCDKLKKAFPIKKGSSKYSGPSVQVQVSSKDAGVEAEDVDFGIEDQSFGDELEDDYDSDEEEGFEETLEEGQDANAPLHVLPLYSLLPTKEQLKIFQDPPEGSRLCVVATNVAETSLTIPGIRYVVDCGRSKERHYEEETGVQSFKVSWTSKASADQRSGRAGRTGPGHCYRIYSSAIFESDFAQFSKPEVSRMPIEGLVLQMKAMGIHNIVNFPFPTPPPGSSLMKGLKLLKYLGVLEGSTDSLTEIGSKMSLFPLSPRFAKMLLISNQLGCLPYVIAIVAALSVGDPFYSEQEIGLDISVDEDEDSFESDLKEVKRKQRQEYFTAQAKFSSLDPSSDALKTLCAVCAYEYEKNTDEFCTRNFLRAKIMSEISKLRKQITHIVAVNSNPETAATLVKHLSSKLTPPSSVQIKAIKQMITAGFIDQVAARADIVSTDVELKSTTRIVQYPYQTLFPVLGTSGVHEDPQDPFVYIHPSSILASSGSTPPDYMVYLSVHTSTGHKAGQPIRKRMRLLTDIGATQLANVAKSSSLLSYSKPLGPPYGPRNITPTKRECWVVPRLGAVIGTGSMGWDLPACKVIQEKEGIHWVVK